MTQGYQKLITHLDYGAGSQLPGLCALGELSLACLPTSFSDTREQVVYEMATCLAKARWVSKGLYDRAVEALDHVGITDVITLMGFYASVAMTLAFYDVSAGETGMER